MLNFYDQILFTKEALCKAHGNFVKFKADNISNKYDRCQSICDRYQNIYRVCLIEKNGEL